MSTIKYIPLIIPDKDDTIPWFKNVTEYDFSALQFINVNSKLPGKLSSLPGRTG